MATRKVREGLNAELEEGEGTGLSKWTMMSPFILKRSTEEKGWRKRPFSV